MYLLFWGEKNELSFLCSSLFTAFNDMGELIFTHLRLIFHKIIKSYTHNHKQDTGGNQKLWRDNRREEEREALIFSFP